MSATLSRRPRVLTLAISVALAVAGASGRAFAGAGHPAAVPTPAPVAPAGQTTVPGLLTPAATSFGSPNTGWSSFAGGAAGQSPSVGHGAPDALVVTSNGPWNGALSPGFTVTPGARYSASGWALARSAGRNVGLALQFHDAAGALISVGKQLGQVLTDNTANWSQTAPVIGLAPPGAVTGNLLFLNYDNAAGDVQWLDDISLSSTYGVAAKLLTPLATQGTTSSTGWAG